MVDPVTRENRITGTLERDYLKNETQSLYIALEHIDFVWSDEQVAEFDAMINKGVTLDEIAKYFGRHIDECALLLMDRHHKGKIKAAVKIRIKTG